MRIAIFTAAVLLAAAPGGARPQRDPAPAATPSGEPETCIRVQSIRNTRVRNDQVIDFYMTGNRVYRNELPAACPSLGFERRIAYRVTNGQLCSIDTIRVLESPGLMEGASCGLGKFQPVTLDDAR